ncbi:rho guanine nucleotide exchange factor 12-like isoform X1 [Acropora palmata]|uniref:rho guanine nucleotide exchange factor 12-like isoform X1 n=1 Tax=Acropora palmata TaxID=6131 RepID=UPI003DA1771E
MEPAENQEGQHLIQHCVIIQRDEKGYGLTVTGDNPVYVQSVKEGGAAHRTGVQVGDKIIKVNGTLVTHFNHAEVVDLIKSGSYVALTLLGKPPAHLHGERLDSTPPPVMLPRDPVKDERVMSVQRVLDQEKQFYKKTREEYMRKPSEKLQKELAESTTRIKTAEAQLNALMQAQPNFSNNGPFSAPPGKTVPPVWQSVTQIPSRCHSVPAEDSVEQDPNALYDNYPLSAIIPNSETADKGPQRSSTPPLPPERKFVPSGDQLGIREGSGHSRQGSSPAAFYRSSPNGSQQDKTFHVRNNVKNKSHDDASGMHLGSPARMRRNILTSSLPMAWTPHNPEKQAVQLSALTGKGNFYNTGSPPPTPSSVHEPMERRNRDDFVEMANERDDSNRAGVIHPSPSCNSIMSMEDDDFASDDEKIDDHGPFNGLDLLKNKPAHLAVFLHYLISNNDPSNLFFWLVTDSYKEGTPKEMKKWFYEIYSTFLADRAPLKVDLDKETIVQPIEKCLGSEDNLKEVFEKARVAAGIELADLLGGFREKRALGLGSLFGDQHLTDDDMDKAKELQVVEQTLIPHLESVLAEIDSNANADASQMDRNSAMASALTTFLKQVGVTIKQQGNSTNVLDRCSSFTRKENKILFKIKSSKKSKGHHFVSTHYTSLTFCNHCNGLLWGIGDQGYQCSTCEYNVHKGNCFEAIEDCPGPKKKRKPIPATVLVPAFNPRKPSQSSTTKSNNNNWNSESQDEDQETQNGVDSKSKRSSLDGDSISSGKDIRSEIDFSRSIDREHLSSGDVSDGMPRYRSESCLDKPPPTKNIARAETMREFRTTRELGPSMKKKRKSAITMDSSSNSDSFLARGDSTLMDPLSEDEEELDPDMTVDAQPPPWQQIVDKKILRKLKTKEIKRQEFIHELIHTERTHVRNLKVLSKVFYKPMLKMNAMFKQEINQLFPNLDALMQIHVSLMGSMMKRQKEEGDVITRIGDVLLERFDGEPGEIAKDACAEFCKNQKLALEQLKNRRKKEFKLEQFITSCENDPLCRRLRLQDIISSSYQRFTKYPLLLEGIQTNTPNSHVDSKNIERAIKCTKDLLAFVNQSVKDCENQQKLADLQKKIDRRSIESTNNKTMEEFKDLDLTKKKLVYDGDLTWRISRTKSVDLHVLLLEDLLILLQKQDDKYVLKCLSTTVIAGYQDTKTTHSPIIKLNGVLARNVATDKRAFFLVSTSATVGPQIYELVTATVTDRKNWYKYITDTAEAFKVKERGRRDAFSVGGQQRAMDVNEINEIPSKSPVKEEEESVDRDKLVGTNADEEEREKATDLDEDDDSDEIDVKNNEEEEDVDEEEEEDETESEAPTTPEEAPATKMAERPLRLESQADSESDNDNETERDSDAESESDLTDVPKQNSSLENDSPTKRRLMNESSPASDSETDVLSAEDSESQSSSVLNQASLAQLTNEESVDDRSLSTERNSVISDSSSSSSNDTMKIRGSLPNMQSEEQFDSPSSPSFRSSVMLLELLRSKDEELRRTLEEKSRLVAELRGANMTTGTTTSESNINSDSMEARDLILAAILQANRLTVAVSDVLNPNVDDMSRGMGCDGVNAVFSPQQQLVSSTSVLNEQLTTLLSVITDRDMARERLRCDLQYANSQIQRYKQGRSSSRRPRELPGSQFSLNDDNLSGGFHSDSPRPSSPTSTIDLDSDYARLSETDYLASEDNMESVARSSSFSSYRTRSSLASSGYRSSTTSSRDTWRSREESPTAQWRRGGGRSTIRTCWSDEGAEYESQSQI